SWGVMPIPLQLAREDNVKQTYLALKEALESKSDANLDSFVKPMYPNIMKDVENPGADPAAWGEHIARIDGQSLAYHDALAYQHPAFFGTTPTMEMKWATLQKLEDETLLNIILGSAPIDSFDAFVEQWKALGGEEITKEVAAEAK
ncbi:MAG TPA: ABC transporter substrate-binding protein, partial [Paenibacillus sp.]|nr:ABC transporter substrate-binding protein [Paenibacillus sp.]